MHRNAFETNKKYVVHMIVRIGSLQVTVNIAVGICGVRSKYNKFNSDYSSKETDRNKYYKKIILKWNNSTKTFYCSKL